MPSQGRKGGGGPGGRQDRPHGRCDKGQAADKHILAVHLTQRPRLAGKLPCGGVPVIGMAGRDRSGKNDQRDGGRNKIIDHPKGQNRPQQRFGRGQREHAKHRQFERARTPRGVGNQTRPQRHHIGRGQTDKGQAGPCGQKQIERQRRQPHIDRSPHQKRQHIPPGQSGCPPAPRQIAQTADTGQQHDQHRKLQDLSEPQPPNRNERVNGPERGERQRDRKRYSRGLPKRKLGQGAPAHQRAAGRAETNCLCDGNRQHAGLARLSGGDASRHDPVPCGIIAANRLKTAPTGKGCQRPLHGRHLADRGSDPVKVHRGHPVPQQHSADQHDADRDGMAQHLQPACADGRALARGKRINHDNSDIGPSGLGAEYEARVKSAGARAAFHASARPEFVKL